MKPKDEAIPILIYCATDEFGMINLVNLVNKSIEWAWQHPHWISVEDELPKEYEEVLAVANIDGNIVPFVGVCENGIFYYTEPTISKERRVTHWMPLPQAPLVTDLNKKDLPPVSWQEGNILVEEKGGKND